MRRPRVVVSEPLSEEAAAWLAARAEVVAVEAGGRPKLEAALGDAGGLVVRTYTTVDSALLDLAPALRVVGRAGVGLDNVDLRACRERGVRVVHTPDANTRAVVEYVFAVLLDALRPRVPLPASADAGVFHRLRRELVGDELAGKTLGVVGMGRIGRRVAALAEAFGMNVVWNDLLSRAELGLSPTGLGSEVALPELWSGADVVTLHVDGRPENRHLVDAEVLSRLSPTCVLVNTARGLLVDRAALAEWAHRAAGAGGRAILDVHDPEPPDLGDPLRSFPNVTLLPHLAARTDRALRAMSWVVKDVLRVLEGEAPEFEAVAPPRRPE